MIDAATAPKIPGLDAALSAGHAQRSDAQAGNGFHDALSHAGQSRHRREGEETVSEGKTGEASPSGDESKTGAAQSAKPTRPLIDISRAALSRAGEDGAANADEATTAKGEVADTADVRKARKAATAHSAAQGETAETLDPAQTAAVARHLQAGKSGGARSAEDTAAGDGAETAADGAAEAKAAGGEADLGDVLTLLSNSASSAQATATTVRAERVAAGQAASGDIPAAVIEAGGRHTAGSADASELPATDAGETGATEADQTFRFLRTDGKGQALSMRVGQSDGETVKYDVGTARDAGQTVEVVEARRFLAPVSNNAAALTSAMIGDGEWASAMLPGSELANAATQSSSGKVVNTLKLQMSPIELGNVTATLRLQGEELSVVITVETHAAHKHLAKDQDEMLKALRAQGFAVDQIQINVNVGAADRADSGQNGAQGQSQGQQAQGGNPGSNGSSERREGAQQSERASGMGMTTDDTSAPQTASGGASASRPGHVYL